MGKQASTLNAFHLVNLLPCANVPSSDPYGLSTNASLDQWGDRNRASIALSFNDANTSSYPILRSPNG